MPSLRVIYEDNHLLVVDKPSGIATMGAESGPTLHSLAGDYLKTKYHKPGNAFVGIVSRLDAMTSGVIVLARTSKAAARLSTQFAGNAADRPRKLYLAVVQGKFEPPQGELIDYVRKDDAAHRMRVVDRNASDAQEAQMRYAVIVATDEVSVLAVELMTGRKHQIRVQLSSRRHPVFGDRKYSSDHRFTDGIALHSWQLSLLHPTTRERLSFEAPIPVSWKPFRSLLPKLPQLRKIVWTAFPCFGDDST